MKTNLLPFIVAVLLIPGSLRGFEIIESIPHAANGGGPSLALLPNGDLSVAYYLGFLELSTNTAQGWESESIIMGDQRGRDPSLMFSSDGTAHVSFIGSSSLFYGRRGPLGEWEIERTPGTGFGLNSDLALSSTDQPHIVSFGWENQDLNYTTENASGWETSVLDSGLPTWSGIGIAVDSQNAPHVVYSYSRDGQNELRHAVRQKDEWEFETLYSSDVSTIYGPDILFDANDGFHVSFIADGNVHYGATIDGEWMTEIVGPNTADLFAPHAAVQTAIALLPDGIPVIAHSEQNQNLLFAKRSETGLWDTAIVAVEQNEAPSMVIGANGFPFIAWKHTSRGQNAQQKQSDLRIATTSFEKLYAGDINQDLMFDSQDLVLAFQAGNYESGEPASWSQGDWNGAPGGFPGFPPKGDGVFDSSDLVVAFQAGLYEQGPYHQNVRSVPEPSNSVAALAILMLSFMRRRKKVSWTEGVLLSTPCWLRGIEN